MSTTTNFTSGGVPIAAELYTPTAAPNGGVVIIAYGSDGLVDNEHGPWATMIRQYASDLAQKGFVALIPDYFLRTKTVAGSIDFLHGGAGIIQLHRNDWQATLEDSVGHAKTLPHVDPARIGLLGFSLGGHLCLRVRETAKVLVEFFAPVLDGLGPSSGVALRAQIHHGKADHLVPFAVNAVVIDQQLRAERVATTLFEDYDGAGHGFAGTDPANTAARTLSSTRTLAFFETSL